VVDGTCPVDIEDDNKWTGVTPKLALEYKAFDDNLLYASYSRGFRSGGYNFRQAYPASLNPTIQAITGGEASFDQETVDAFEVGFKYTSSDNRVRVNTAIFHNIAEDLQREINVVSPTGGVIQLIVNSADAEMTGLEVEGQFQITDNFALTGNVGLLDAEYTSLSFPISAVSLNDLLTGQATVNDADLGLDLPRAPDTTYGLGFIWEQSLGNAGSLVTQANWQHRSESFYSDNNLGFFNPADNLDVNIEWVTPMEGVTLSLYGKNLLDEVQAGNDTQLPPVIGSPALAPLFTPLGGTFSPLKKGARVGLELIIRG
jgi:iron complex outermembrane receptor protein